MNKYIVESHTALGYTKGYRSTPADTYEFYGHMPYDFIHTLLEQGREVRLHSEEIETTPAEEDIF